MRYIFSFVDLDLNTFDFMVNRNKYTLPESNVALENRPSQNNESSLPTINFQVRTVSFREGTFLMDPIEMITKAHVSYYFQERDGIKTPPKEDRMFWD